MTDVNAFKRPLATLQAKQTRFKNRLNSLFDETENYDLVLAQKGSFDIASTQYLKALEVYSESLDEVEGKESEREVVGNRLQQAEDCVFDIERAFKAFLRTCGVTSSTPPPRTPIAESATTVLRSSSRPQMTPSNRIAAPRVLGTTSSRGTNGFTPVRLGASTTPAFTTGVSMIERCAELAKRRLQIEAQNRQRTVEVEAQNRQRAASVAIEHELALAHLRIDEQTVEWLASGSSEDSKLYGFSASQTNPNTVIEFLIAQTSSSTVPPLEGNTAPLVLPPPVASIRLPTPLHPMHVGTDGTVGVLRQLQVSTSSCQQQCLHQDARKSPDLIGFDPPTVRHSVLTSHPV